MYNRKQSIMISIMNKKMIMMTMAVAIGTAVQAQTLESNSDFPTGYLVTNYYDKSNTIQSIDGVLYLISDDIPIVLVKYPPMNPREEFEVPSSVRRISNNAFQGTKFLKTLKIHNTVSDGRFLKLVIGESAFNDSSIENFEVIENNEETVSHISKKTTEDRTEEGRYDLSGRKVEAGDDGVQIVVYNDKTAKKVLK